MYELEPLEQITFGKRVKNLIRKLFSSTFAILQTLVFIAAIFVILYIVLITPHQVDGMSMDPTFKDQEYLIANKIIYKTSSPKRGDVVIFKYSETRDFIKRVIAVAGDSIMVQGGQYVLNDVVLDESEYLAPTVYTSSGAYMHEGEKIYLQEGEVFVSGDNRPYSSDSRAFGPISITQIKGKVWFVIYPFGNIRLVEHPDYNL